MLPLALLAAQIDFAFIMLSAGVYKFTAGYPHNHGMELGMCNPMWGYWWRWYASKRPNSPAFWTLNQLAWTTEIVAALLMLIPATRELGALLIIGSFAFIATQIRLGFLCEMVMVSALLFMSPSQFVGGRLDAMLGAAVPPAPAASEPLTTILGVAIGAYLVLLPLAHAGLYYNFYAGRSLPHPLQRALERYTNFFGIIIWRVFSVDLVNFFIRLSRRRGDEQIALRPLGSWPRFNHVGEDDLSHVALHDAQVLPEQRSHLSRARRPLRAHVAARAWRPSRVRVRQRREARQPVRLGERRRIRRRSRRRYHHRTMV